MVVRFDYWTPNNRPICKTWPYHLLSKISPSVLKCFYCQKLLALVQETVWISLLKRHKRHLIKKCNKNKNSCICTEYFSHFQQVIHFNPVVRDSPKGFIHRDEKNKSIYLQQANSHLHQSLHACSQFPTSSPHFQTFQQKNFQLSAGNDITKSNHQKQTLIHIIINLTKQQTKFGKLYTGHHRRFKTHGYFKSSALQLPRGQLQKCSKLRFKRNYLSNLIDIRLLELMPEETDV